MPVTYSPAPEVRTIAEQLIAEVGDHWHLHGYEIRYVFRSEAARSGGKLVLGKARKKQGLDAYLAVYQPDEIPDPSDGDPMLLVVEIARDTWEMLEPRQKRALVDHELSHFKVEEDSKGEEQLIVAAHDLEEFCGVVARHGAWRPDVSRFIRALGSDQLRLFADSPPADPTDPDPHRVSDDSQQEPDQLAARRARRGDQQTLDDGEPGEEAAAASTDDPPDDSW